MQVSDGNQSANTNDQMSELGVIRQLPGAVRRRETASLERSDVGRQCPWSGQMSGDSVPGAVRCRETASLERSDVGRQRPWSGRVLEQSDVGRQETPRLGCSEMAMLNHYYHRPPNTPQLCHLSYQYHVMRSLTHFLTQLNALEKPAVDRLRKVCLNSLYRMQ